MKNPILKSDFPDPDVIRVEDTYYMVSTTMHFMPGAILLRSYDLLHWEICGHVYDELENLPSHHLSEGENIYAQGMWAPCLRYHKGKFYVSFSANDTKKTYVFIAEHIEGPWEKRIIKGFYYDSSILFDDERVFIFHGNTTIRVTELEKDLSGPKKDGVDRVIIKDEGNISLGYEGSHVYKINGKYVLFMIHWPADGNKRRCEACYTADSIEGEFVGKDILDDDMNYLNQGVAQGGIVDTPSGDWYMVLFQDRGAVGRIPVVVPMEWNNDFPRVGKVPADLGIASTKNNYVYKPLMCSGAGAFCEPISPSWEWNHLPEKEWIDFTHGDYHIRTHELCPNMICAKNTLTQRLFYPGTRVEVTLDASKLNDGDVAGLCALQNSYAFLSIIKKQMKYYLSMVIDDHEIECVELNSPQARLAFVADFEQMKDEVVFSYYNNDMWTEIGTKHHMVFDLKHFVGYRAALFMYSKKLPGGEARFSSYLMTVNSHKRK